MTKGFWDDMGDHWVWRDSPDGGDYCDPPSAKEAAYIPVNGVLRCVGVWVKGKYTHLFKTPEK